MCCISQIKQCVGHLQELHCAYLTMYNLIPEDLTRQNIYRVTYFVILTASVSPITIV
jgi:hypothetical protein